MRLAPDNWHGTIQLNNSSLFPHSQNSKKSQSKWCLSKPSNAIPSHHHIRWWTYPLEWNNNRATSHKTVQQNAQPLSTSYVKVSLKVLIEQTSLVKGWSAWSAMHITNIITKIVWSNAPCWRQYPKVLKEGCEEEISALRLEHFFHHRNFFQLQPFVLAIVSCYKCNDSGKRWN